MLKLFRPEAGAWRFPVRRLVALHWTPDGVGYQAYATMWGTGGVIAFTLVGSDCPFARYGLKQRYWTLAYIQELEVYAMSFLRKAAKEQAAKRREPSPFARDVQDKLPALHEYLTVSEWPNGDQRVTSTILLFADDGVFKVCLNDRQEEQSLWAAGDGLWDALELLEATLQAGTGEWRRNTFSKPKKAKGGPRKSS